MVSLPFWKIYCLDFASANISLLELPSFQLILLDDVYSWHWLLCASPMIFSRSSILKGHEHLIWIIITYVWVLCFIMYLLSLYLFSRNVTKFTNYLQILGNYLLKAKFWLYRWTVCSVNQCNSLLGKGFCMAWGDTVYLQIGCASIIFNHTTYR